MPDFSAIASALSALNSAKDIAQAMIGLRDTAEFQSKLIEFQGKLIDANSAALAAHDERSKLVNEIEALKRELDDLRAWDVEKRRYALTEVGDAAFAYIVKADERGTEPTHCICPECYQREQKSILQMEKNYYGSVTLVCPKCTTKIKAQDTHPKYPFERNAVKRQETMRTLSTQRRNPFGSF